HVNLIVADDPTSEEIYTEFEPRDSAQTDVHIPPNNAPEQVTPASQPAPVGQPARAEPHDADRHGSRSSQAPGLKLTLWRIINSCVLLGLGIPKAILAYKGNPAVNTVDMAAGLIWAFMWVFYILGLHYL
ncbi:hypothetical protein DXG01_012781, partial [Tephrocybe rancida]